MRKLARNDGEGEKRRSMEKIRIDRGKEKIIRRTDREENGKKGGR